MAPPAENGPSIPHPSIPKNETVFRQAIRSKSTAGNRSRFARFTSDGPA